MDNTSTLRSLPTLAISPSLHFHFTSSDEGFQVQKLVDSLDEAVATRFLQAHIFEEHLLFFVAFEFSDVGFCLSADNEEFSIFILDSFANSFYVRVTISSRSIVYVTYIENRLGSQEEETLSGSDFVFGFEDYGTGRLTLQEGITIGREDIKFQFSLLVTTHASLLFYALDAVFYGFKVLQLKFCIDDFLIAYRVYRAVYVYDVVIVEATEYVNDGIGFTDISQELVTQSFALASTLNQTCNVHDIASSRNDTSWFYQLSQFVQSFIGYRNLSLLCIDSAERIVSTLRFCA